MKKLCWAPVGLLGIFALAGCGSSGNGDNGGGTGTPDASVESGPSNGGDSGPGPGADSGPTTGDDGPVTTGDGAPSCGNGVVEGTESCDDGANNGATGDPCNNACAWVCIAGDPTQGDKACDDGNPCNGAETCKTDHTCAAGTALGQGASCGTAKICNGGVCADAICGDGITTAPEECDDGSNNGTPTDGCSTSCKYVCVSADPLRNCTPADACAGKGTCNDTTHVCAPGTPLGNGTPCGGSTADAGAPDGGAFDVCNAGTCTAATCGDSIIEPGEQCDDGANNGKAGAGCTNKCQFECKLNPNDCPQPTDVCVGPNTCTAITGGQTCIAGSALTDGTPCASGGTCQGGHCQAAATCGNGTLDPGEQCDFGKTGTVSNNKPGSGCEPGCTFSCAKNPDNCTPLDACAASPMSCQNITGPNNDVGQKCQAAPHTTTCGVCDTTLTGNFVCVSSACAASKCGDGCIDSRIGETCEPPSSATCDASCHTIVPAVCGNKKRETGEQCDDGNTTNLDGCDSKCQFEQDHRAITVAIAYTGGPATTCTNNMLGTKVLTSTAGSTLNSNLTTAVNAGTTNIQFKFLGLTDLSGITQASGLNVGALTGVPTSTTGYNGASDKDWWYTTSASTVDANRNPKSQLAGTLTSGNLKATGTIDLSLLLGGSPALLHLSGSLLTAKVGATSVPATSTGNPPGHLAAENLDPALKSFDSMSNGVLCGNISAASLATVPMPAQLTTGLTACTSPVYTASNSLLDAIVNGCTAGIFPILIGVINASPKPDQVDPGVPAAGAGAPYTLTSSNGTSADGCKDKNGTSVTLSTCLAAAAYSADFTFTSDRVIMK